MSALTPEEIAVITVADYDLAKEIEPMRGDDDEDSARLRTDLRHALLNALFEHGLMVPPQPTRRR